MIAAMESLHHRLREGKWADLGNGVGTYGPFLALVPPEKLAVLTIHEVVNAVVKHGNAGVPLATLLMGIAEAVRTEVCGWVGGWVRRGGLSMCTYVYGRRHLIEMIPPRKS